VHAAGVRLMLAASCELEVVEIWTVDTLLLVGFSLACDG